MKTIILNASPRKRGNTAEALQEVKAGAERVGKETEYVDLYDLDFLGCRSCLQCKRKGAERNRCYWKDDLSPLIERVYREANALVIGSPVYFGDVTSQFHALIERLCFPALSYDDYSSYFTGKINVGVVLTMNATPKYWDELYAEKIPDIFAPFRFLNGSVKILKIFDTLQVKDYSKYNMAAFSEEHKKEVRETQFPQDLRSAFELGSTL